MSGRWRRRCSDMEHIANVTEAKGYGAVPNRLVESVNSMTNTAMRAGTLLGLDPRAKAQIMALTASTESSMAGLDRYRRKGRCDPQASLC